MCGVFVLYVALPRNAHKRFWTKTAFCTPNQFFLQFVVIQQKLPDHKPDTLSIICSPLDLEKDTEQFLWSAWRSRPHTNLNIEAFPAVLCFYAPIQDSCCVYILKIMWLAEHNYIFPREYITRFVLVWQTRVSKSNSSSCSGFAKGGKLQPTSQC